MRLTIIRDMGLVHVDGNGFDELDMSDVPEDVHALQWYGSSGEIEYNDGKGNVEITELPAWADLAKAKKDAKDSEIAAEEAAAEAYANSTEGKAEAARAQRDKLIAETDWWASSDLTMTQEQIDYRQALRDITSQAGFPDTITWPVKP